MRLTSYLRSATLALSLALLSIPLALPPRVPATELDRCSAICPDHHYQCSEIKGHGLLHWCPKGNHAF
jgi:hypothetical protein